MTIATQPPTLFAPASKYILCVRLTNWSIDRLCRRRAELRRSPLALASTKGNRRFIAASCVRARKLGVRPGIDQAEAMAVCPSLTCLPHDLVADERGLRSLERWMMRFTPIVSIAPEMPDALLLDVTGCERVFQGLDKLVRRVAVSVKRFGLEARIALGPNPGAAWAMTFAPELSPSPGTPVEGRGLRRGPAKDPHPDPLPEYREREQEGDRALASIPCEALRLDDDIVARLYHLGVHTIGQLLRFPREQLPARFGRRLTLRLDQLLGHVPEPLVPLEPPAVVSARMDFDGVVTSLEALWAVFRDLVARVITQLVRRGQGVRELEVTFVRAYAPPLVKTIRLSRPSRDPVNLFNLFRCATEQLDDGSGNDEFLGMRLLVRVHEPLPDEQIGLLDGENYAGERELDRLIERLCARLGEESITQAEPVESYVPERAWVAWACTHARGRRLRKSSAMNSARPLLLLPRPREVSVTVNPFNADFGQPMQFVSARRQVHRLSHVIGPERISGEWWDGHNKTRDYFNVEDESGKRFWLFRVNETRRWYLHGQYA